MKLLAASILFLSLGAHASNLCQKLDAKPAYLQALTVVATNMQYTMSEICSHERILDIQIDNTKIINKDGQVEPHIWVTLHYNEYSCQYFVRDEDMIVTRKNCYNTF